MENKQINSSPAIQDHKIIENLAKKTVCTTQLASQRGRPPDKVGPKTDILLGQDQTVTFPVDQQTHGRVRLSAAAGGPQNDEMLSHSVVSMGLLMRPKSPTRQCAVPETDISHIGLALMESKVGSDFSEKYFNIREHELVCAISSQTSFLDSEGCLVSSVDVTFYWCNFCTFSTSTKTALLQHVMEHRFHCRHCCYQSFSRADVIQHAAHTHTDFQETAANIQYCTLLSDYLRICHAEESQRNNVHRRNAYKRKRQHEDGCDDSVQPLSKVRKTGLDNGKRKAQEAYSAGFVLFDVDVEKAEDGDGMTPQESRSKSSSPPSLEEVREVETPQAVGSSSTSFSNLLSGSASCNSTPSSLSVVSKQCDPTQLFSKCNISTSWMDFNRFSVVQGDGQDAMQSSPTLPPDLMPEAPPSSLQHPTSYSDSSLSSSASLSPMPPPPKLSCADMESNEQMHLDWTCTHCKITCVTEDGLKCHFRYCHRREEPAMELVTSSAPKLLRYVDGKSSSSGANQNCEPNLADESQTNSPADQNTSDEPPILVKQGPVKFCTEEIQAPIPCTQTKDTADLKCYHCHFSTSLIENLRSHILVSHKGKSLNGLDPDNKIMYVCLKSSCTFTSSFGLSFLSHVQECIPWPQPASSNVPLEKILVECLEATTALAENDMLSSHCSSSSVSDSSKEDLDEFSCIHCNSELVWNKAEAKQHVLDCHGSNSLVLRNMHAFSKKRKSHVFFCRWCSWEGNCNVDYTRHCFACPHQDDKDTVSVNYQSTNQTRRISCESKSVKENKSTCGTDSDNVCLKQAGRCEGEAGIIHSSPTLPLATSPAKDGAEAKDSVCDWEHDAVFETPNSIHSNFADKKDPPDVIHGQDFEDDAPKMFSLTDASFAGDVIGMPRVDVGMPRVDSVVYKPHSSRYLLHGSPAPEVIRTTDVNMDATSISIKMDTAETGACPVDIPSENVNSADNITSACLSDIPPPKNTSDNTFSVDTSNILTSIIDTEDNVDFIDMLSEIENHHIKVSDMFSSYNSVSNMSLATSTPGIRSVDTTSSGWSSQMSSDITVGISHKVTNFPSDIGVAANRKYQTSIPPVISPCGDGVFQTCTTPDLSSADIGDRGCPTDVKQDGSIDDNSIMSPGFTVVGRIEYSSLKSLENTTGDNCVSLTETVSSGNYLDSADRQDEQSHVEGIGSPFTPPKTDSAEGGFEIDDQTEYLLPKIPLNNTSDSCVSLTKTARASSGDCLDSADRQDEQGHVKEIRLPFTPPKTDSAEGGFKIDGQAEYLLHKIPLNNTGDSCVSLTKTARASSGDCLDSADRQDEQGHVEKIRWPFTSSETASPEGGLQPAGTARSCQHDAGECTTNSSQKPDQHDAGECSTNSSQKQDPSPEQDHSRSRQGGARGTISRKSISQNVWFNSSDRIIECIKCGFQSTALCNLRSHVLDNHSQQVSVPFRSLYHKDMHYKCNFFACPSQECMVYDYDEMVVVKHYRLCHNSQPHSYLDPSYVAAPVKQYRRRKNKRSHESKNVSKPHIHSLPRAAKSQNESKQKPYMCLYCDDNIYTNMVAEMKDHYLSRHAGQVITIRDVSAFRDKKLSRLFVCDQPQCDFFTDDEGTLDKHAVQHSIQVADLYYQCVACGWITSDYSAVQNHVSTVHENEGGATVVTLTHDDQQRAVDERFVPCITYPQLN